MLRLLKTPKIQMALALALIFITALIHQPSILLLFRFIISVVFAIGIDVTLLKIRKVEPFIPSAGFVSACIIGLLFAPNLPLVELFLAVFLTMVSKHFIRFNKKHIFNPAAFGLFLGGLIFGHDVSWWGVSWQRLTINNYQSFFSFLILLLPAYVSCFKMKRIKIIIPFLFTYSLANYFLIRNVAILDPTVLFFSLVMLPEPMTTPNKSSRQILFGFFVALVSILISYPISTFNFQLSTFIPDPLVGALLIGNFLFFRQR